MTDTTIQIAPGLRITSSDNQSTESIDTLISGIKQFISQHNNEINHCVQCFFVCYVHLAFMLNGRHVFDIKLLCRAVKLHRRLLQNRENCTENHNDICCECFDYLLINLSEFLIEIDEYDVLDPEFTENMWKDIEDSLKKCPEKCLNLSNISIN